MDDLDEDDLTRFRALVQYQLREQEQDSEPSRPSQSSSSANSFTSSIFQNIRKLFTRGRSSQPSASEDN